MGTTRSLFQTPRNRWKVFGTGDEARSPSFWNVLNSRMKQYEIMQWHVFSGIALFPCLSLLINKTSHWNAWSQMKNMFPLRWKPNGVLSGVSLGIMIHPPDSNGRPLLAFDCRRELMSLRMVRVPILRSNNKKGLTKLVSGFRPHATRPNLTVHEQIGRYSQAKV